MPSWPFAALDSVDALRIFGNGGPIVERQHDQIVTFLSCTPSDTAEADPNWIPTQPIVLEGVAKGGEYLVYRFINKFTIRMIDGILVRNQNGHHFKTSQTGLER